MSIEENIHDKIESLIKDCFDELLLEKLDISSAIGGMDNDYISDDEMVIDAVEQQINDYDIIGHSKAMEYLSNNDPSLTESFSIVSDLSIDINDLSSESLATAHIRDKLHGLSYDCCVNFSQSMLEYLDSVEV